ncbi:ThuA domain-containing protein [Kitasatospora sp. NPDC096147]|uniref:ThuA domain-containing protein n=1 Tax=Kitasatospora sp. NPDC096147 TaxID=3364093 RepID=UPI0038132077
MPRHPASRRLPQAVLTLLGLLLAALAPTAPTAQAAPLAPDFKVIAFYSGTWDAAHIDFVKEANDWFPKTAAANNFTYTATTNWDLLANGGVDAYDVVLFLDDAPQSVAQRAGFERYMRGGGAWLGFHVSAFTTNASAWDWYYNRFLGSGNFRSNTWGPTTAVLRTENAAHPAAASLPATWTSAVSEWYAWSNNLRANPNVKVLASVDASSFPLGTDPNQSWYSGDYPIVWTNTQYRMLYANFGHNAMNYSTNTRTSSTFASAAQNRLLIDALKWLGKAPVTTAPWYSVTSQANGLCVDARSAATANGTAIQQYTCNSTTAQDFRLTATDSGYVRLAARNNPDQVVDVTGVSTADNAPLQLWAYGGGANQQWRPVAEAGGAQHFVARHSGKCLTVATTAATDSVQLVQRTCDNSPAQSFRLAARP